jgi:hypothetical protein
VRPSKPSIRERKVFRIGKEFPLRQPIMRSHFGCSPLRRRLTMDGGKGRVDPNAICARQPIALGSNRDGHRRALVRRGAVTQQTLQRDAGE